MKEATKKQATTNTTTTKEEEKTMKLKGIQFNSKNAKDFRDKATDYHVGTFQLYDRACKYQDKVKSYNDLINSTLDDIENVDKAIKPLAELKEDLQGFLTAKDECKKAYTSYKEEMEALRKPFLDLFTDELYNNYKESVKDYSKLSDYKNIISAWFTRQGCTVIPDKLDISQFASIHGRKLLRNKQAYRKNALTGEHAKKYYNELFASFLVEYMQDSKIIKPYEWTYTPPKKDSDSDTTQQDRINAILGDNDTTQENK